MTQIHLDLIIKQSVIDPIYKKWPLTVIRCSPDKVQAENNNKSDIGNYTLLPLRDNDFSSRDQ